MVSRFLFAVVPFPLDISSSRKSGSSGGIVFIFQFIEEPHTLQLIYSPVKSVQEFFCLHIHDNTVLLLSVIAVLKGIRHYLIAAPMLALPTANDTNFFPFICGFVFLLLTGVFQIICPFLIGVLLFLLFSFSSS